VAPFRNTSFRGRHKGHTFLIYIWHDGRTPTVNRFEVELFYRDLTRLASVTVARIQNRSGATVFEKEFRPTRPTVAVSLNWRDAYRRVHSNWFQYVTAYDQNHGL